jgi:cytosine/adenosine deaminase-related metal-dependent hydrolase/C-terminal processing protease CtpA/Prc
MATTPIDPMTGPRYILDGRVVTMNDRFDVIDRGRVYIDAGSIVAVQDAGTPRPDGFRRAPLVKTGGTIYPGLIELHNHLSYNVLPLWQVPRHYGNRGTWRNSPDKKRLISGPMRVLGSTGGIIESIVRYVEAKALVGGVTTSQGITLISTAIPHHYRGIVRNVEKTDDAALPRAATRVGDVKDAAAFRRRLDANTTLLLHLAEGIDDTARKHFKALRIKGRRWAITDSLAGIHCAGLRGRDFATLRSRGGKMVWSPLSNLLLYGETADIKRARDEGVLISLGSDWSPSGSKNLLGELKVARLVSDKEGGLFSARELVAMATINPARTLKWDGALGSLEAGKRADMVVVDNRRGDPYDHLIDARETSIVLAVINGIPRYGQPRLMDRFEGDKESLSLNSSRRSFFFTQETADPVVAALSLSEATERLKDGLRRLPELAQTLADPATAMGSFGITADDRPGTWVLDLDNEGFDNRSLAPDSFADRLTAGVQPLDQTLESITLDPLTVVTDDRFFHRLVNQANLPEYVKEGLPRVYGTTAPKPDPSVFSMGTAPSLGRDARGPATLAELNAAAGLLTLADRKLLVDQAQVLLDDAYVHLNLKEAMHAVSPIQRLRLLRHQLSRATSETMGEESMFHREMTSIFTELRDLHTNYLLPSPFREHTAFLPFLAEECFDSDGTAHYLVTKLAPDFEHPTFDEGAELLYWNGVPIAKAIRANAAGQAGSNPAARFARGLDALTIRPLVRSLPPDEEWVIIGYRAADGRELETRLEWKVWSPGSAPGIDPDGGDSVALAGSLGYDLQTDAVNQARKALYAPAAIRGDTPIGGRMVDLGGGDLATTMPTVFRAREVTTPSGDYGYIRIFTFNVPSAEMFIEEFARLADELPATGLIIDVRNNGGGLITAAEGLLQVLTPKIIEPSPAQFVTTPLMLRLVENHSPSPLDASFTLAAWLPSLELAVRTGATLSTAHPITEPAVANGIGQRYHGPVVLITDALCYSATDMFAAGFQDHEIGIVLGIADATGAGGANVWTHKLLRILAGDSEDSPLEALPHNSGMRVSVRRTLRVRDRAGTPVEDLGVVPDERYHMTRTDILEHNDDLIGRAGDILSDLPRYRLDGEVTTGAAKPAVRVTMENLDRLDIAFDDRCVASHDVSDGTKTFRPAVASPEVVDLTGYKDGVAVARRKIHVGS